MADDTKRAPLRFALSISKSATRQFNAPMLMDASSCIAGVRHRWYTQMDLCGIARQLCDALLWTEATDISLNLMDRDATIAACPEESLWLDQAHVKVMCSTLRSVEHHPRADDKPQNCCRATGRLDLSAVTRQSLAAPAHHPHICEELHLRPIRTLAQQGERTLGKWSRVLRLELRQHSHLLHLHVPRAPAQPFL